MQLTSKLIPRGKYVSGRGVTGAGLTATVVRDEQFLGGWVLEAGALVMANRSVCCLHPSSTIVWNDEIIPISKLFDEKKAEKVVCNGEIMDIHELNGLTPSFNIDLLRTSRERAILIRRKRYRGKILNLRLNSGFEIKLTPEHLLIDGDRLVWKKAEDFKEGEFVLAPLKLPNRREKIFIFDLIPDDWKVCLSREEKGEIKREALKKYKSIAEFNRKIKLRREILCGDCQPTMIQFKNILEDLNLEEEWKRRKLKYGRKHGSIRLKISEVTPELGYIFGFLAGDGYLNREKTHGSIRVTQSIKHKKYIENFIKNWDEVFPSELHEHEDRRESEISGRKVKGVKRVLYHRSNLLVLLYDKLIGKSFEKILRLPDKVLKAFVAGVFDSDGCISIKKSNRKGREYKVAHVEFLLSKNPVINLNFMLALRRLDVYSKLIKTDRNVDIIRITGREDVVSLKNSISNFSSKIKVRIPERKHEVSSSSNKLPKFLVAEICKRILDEINTSLLNRTGLRMVYPYINLDYQPSRDGMRRILDEIGNHLSERTKDGIEKLLQRDFFIDKIVSIDSENYDGFVYDLYVPENHSFFAGGIFVHNCIDEFSKVSPQDQVALQEAMSLETWKLYL
jgi:replicative DNA helicase Mcm